MVEILEKVKSHFGAVDRPYYGPTYILPDGSLLNLDGRGHHSVVEHHLIENGLSNREYIKTDGSPTIEALGCIRCDMVKYYIGLSEEQPTREQYNSLLVWLDQHSRFTRIITVISPGGEQSTDYRFNSDFISDDVVDRIRRYYVCGKLYEQLDTSVQFRRQHNFKYKREVLGEALTQADEENSQQENTAVNYISKQTSYDIAHEIATKAKKVLGLSEYDQETLEHDINNLRAHEWIDLFNMIPDSNEVKKLYFTHCVELEDENEQELKEDMRNSYFTPYGYKDAMKVLNGKAPTYYYHLKEIEMDSGDGAKLANYAKKLGLNVIQDPDSDPDYPTWYIPGEYHWDDYFYPYPYAHEYIIDDKKEQELKEDMEAKTYKVTLKYRGDAKERVEKRVAKNLSSLEYQLNHDKSILWYDIEDESSDETLDEGYEDVHYEKSDFEVYYFGQDETLYEQCDEEELDFDDYKVEWYKKPGYYYVTAYGDVYIDNEYISSKADFEELCYGLTESIHNSKSKNLDEGYSKEGYSWDEVNGMIHIYEDGKLIDTYPDMGSAEEAGWDLGILTEGLGLMKCDNCGSVYNSIPFGAYGMIKCFVCGGRTFNFLKDDKGMVGSSYNFKDSKEKDIPTDKVDESLNSRWKKMFGEPYKDSMSKATPQQLDDLKKRLLDTEKDKDERQTSKEIAHESYSMRANTLTEDSAALADQKKKFAEYQEKLNEVNKKIEELLDKKRKYDSATPEEKKQMDMIEYMDGIESSMSDYEQKQKHYMKEMELLDKQIKNNGENENPQVEDPKETGYGLAIFQNGKYVQGKVYKNSDEVNAVVNKVYKTKTGSGSLILVGIRPDKTLGVTIELKLGSHPSFNEIKKIQIPNDIKSQMNQVAKDLGFGGLKESLDQTREKALKMKESSNAFAILYGYRTKDGKEVDLEPEEFATEKEYKERIQQITDSFTKLSDKGPRGNRYGKESGIEFYAIYPNKNSSISESTMMDTLKAKYPVLDNTWTMGSDKTKLNNKEFELLYALADKLASTSPNQYKYEVKETYEDYGAGMKWYNIICYDKKGNSWQVLNTKEWLDLMNTGDVDRVYQDVVNGDYFQDKQKDIKDMNMGELFNHMED